MQIFLHKKMHSNKQTFTEMFHSEWGGRTINFLSDPFLSFFFLLLMQAVPVKLCLGVVVHVLGGHVVQARELVHPHHVSRMLVGQRRMHLVHRHRVHRRHLVLLLPLHPAVLEPDLDLPFGQAEGVSDFNSPSSGQVSVEVELLLQLQGLVSGVRGPLPFGFAVLIHCI